MFTKWYDLWPNKTRQMKDNEKHVWLQKRIRKNIMRHFRCFHNYHHRFGVQKTAKQTSDTDLCTGWQRKFLSNFETSLLLPPSSTGQSIEFSMLSYKMTKINTIFHSRACVHVFEFVSFHPFCFSHSLYFTKKREMSSSILSVIYRLIEKKQEKNPLHNTYATHKQQQWIHRWMTLIQVC